MAKRLRSLVYSSTCMYLKPSAAQGLSIGELLSRLRQIAECSSVAPALHA